MAGPDISGGSPKLLMIAVKNSISSGGGEAFQWAVEKIIADNVTAFKLILLHVLPEPKSTLPHFFSRLCSKTSPCNESPENSRRIQFLEDIEEMCKVKGIVCEEHIKVGDPKKQICAAVELFKPNMLIVGNRNRDITAFQKLFYPRVCEYCAKHAKCPVVRFNRNVETVEALEDPCDD